MCAFMHCLGSFLLQDVLLSLHEFSFGGQNMKFTVNMLPTCILCCDTGSGCDQNRWILITDKNGKHGPHRRPINKCMKSRDASNPSCSIQPRHLVAK